MSDRSPDLAASPHGGAPGWDHIDKYAPDVALVDLDGDGVLDRLAGGVWGASLDTGMGPRTVPTTFTGTRLR